MPENHPLPIPLNDIHSMSEAPNRNENNVDDKSQTKTPLRSITKSSEDEELIRLALHRNPYFTCLDEEQIENFIQVAEIHTFRPGQAVILEGCRDERDEDADHHELESQVVLESALADTDDLLDYEITESSEEGTTPLEKSSVDNIFLPRVSDIAILVDGKQGNDEKNSLGTTATKTHEIVSSNQTDERRQRFPSIPFDQIPPPSSGSKAFLYVVRKGNADVFYDTINPASLGPGTLFGEGGFLFGRQHSASIVAGSPLECWVVEHSTFLNHVLQSDNLKRLFARSAHREDGEGKLFMTMEDFIQACLQEEKYDHETDPSSGTSVANAYQNILRTSARGNKKHNKIYLSDFCLFHLLMARPDPEVDIAFLLMDRQKMGALARADFEEYLSNLPYFDPNSEFVERHFGQGQTIRSYQFSQFLVDLQKEMGRQAFLHRAKQLKHTTHKTRGAGYLPPEEFISVLKSTCGWRLPDGIVNRLESLYCKGPIQSAEATAMASVRAGTIKGDTPELVTDYSTRSVLAEMEYRGNRLGTRYFTYVDFLAFQDVLGQLPGICNLIERACDIKAGPVSPDDFKVANRVFGLGGWLSRRQVDIIFQLFDLDRDGFVSAEDAVSVCGLEYAFRLEPVAGREGKFTFAPPPNYPKKASDIDDIIKAEGESLDRVSSAESTQSGHIVRRILTHATQFLLASVAGGIGILTVYPLDFVKTRMMNQRIGADGKRMYLQSFDCLRKSLAHEGFYGLYRGLLPPLLAVGPEKAIKFVVNDLLRGLSNKDGNGKNIHWFMEIVSGGCAGACQLLVTNPLEITKIRMQLQGETARVFKEKGLPVPKPMSFSEVAVELGLSGLYKGAAACLLRDIPFGAIYFPAYAVCKDYLVRQENSSGAASVSNILLAGTMAGIPASLLTTPADMVKTRLQVVPRPGEARYSGIGDCIQKIYRTEGPTAFFKGSLFRVCRIAPQFGISLLGYETLSQMVGVQGYHVTPPTNAPVDPHDYRTAFPTSAIGKKTHDIDKLMENLGFNNSKKSSSPEYGGKRSDS
jgi:solute carrier family 25 aspartate/glutamate transporter 12/13